MLQIAPPTGLHVADLCTGSGVVALQAAQRGATTVNAFDVCTHSVRCARDNARRSGLTVRVHRGNWSRAVEFGPFDLVLANPPYVPGNLHDVCVRPRGAGPTRAFHAGQDGRLVLGPLCAGAYGLLRRAGILLLVQSEFADITQSLAALSDSGLTTEVVAEKQIPFGPVMASRAQWLERTGRLEAGRRTERLVVIAATRP